MTIVSRSYTIIEPESDALLSSFTTRPTRARALLIDDLIRSLKDGGIWTKLDALWVTAAHADQAARQNWKSPGVYTLTDSGTPTFTTDRGYSATSGTVTLSTGFTPSVAGVQYVLDSASVMFWSRTSGLVNVGDIGASTTLDCGARRTGDVARISLNDVTLDASASVTDGSGFFVFNRSSSTLKQVYRQGSQVGTDITRTSTAVPSAGALTIKLANAGTAQREIALAGIGGSLSSADVSALYTAVQTYMTGVGA